MSQVVAAGELDDLSVIAGGIGHFVSGEGEYPELVKQTDALHKDDHDRFKTQQRQPKPKNEASGKVTRPGLA